ncbi:MAG: lactoylglutathione lyase [Gammaproteobacteria bacterium]|jgi:lactoylglutathione lyase
MRLAKPHLDIGLFTNEIAEHRAFWGESVGLRLDHELTLEKGWVQHRYDAHDSVIKINHITAPLDHQPRSGYVGLTIAGNATSNFDGQHPNGDHVRVVPPGTDGIVGIGITVGSPDPDRLMKFYVEALEFEQRAPYIACCGDTLLFVEEGPGGRVTENFIGPAFRYLTVQIFDADAACDQVVARGGRLAQACRTLGEVARYGLVCDPDGNWIEMSARASLTGIIPTPDA